MSENNVPDTLEKEDPKFSALHPSDLLQKIIDDGATQLSFENIYRISEDGACNRDAFICSLLQDYYRDGRDAYLAQKQQEYDVGEWSTSCWNDLKRARKIYDAKEKHDHFQAMLIGDISPESGYSIMSIDRKSIQKWPSDKRRKKRGHIDWWIFEDQDVSGNFKIIELENEDEKEVETEKR